MPLVSGPAALNLSVATISTAINSSTHEPAFHPIMAYSDLRQAPCGCPALRQARGPAPTDVSREKGRSLVSDGALEGQRPLCAPQFSSACQSCSAIWE